ncbi:MAG: hypothetical protein ACLSHC_05240 [Bilophila wadsworthia]
MHGVRTAHAAAVADGGRHARQRSSAHRAFTGSAEARTAKAGSAGAVGVLHDAPIWSDEPAPWM